MASEEQYKFFQTVYDEENDRYTLLEGRAKVYITILTFYIGALAFKASDVVQILKEYRAPVTGAVLICLTFIASLGCCVFALRIKTFEAITDPEEVIAAWPDEGLADEEFFDARIADFAVATKRNAKQNDEAARALALAGWLLFAGVLTQAVVFLLTLARG